MCQRVVQTNLPSLIIGFEGRDLPCFLVPEALLIGSLFLGAGVDCDITLELNRTEVNGLLSLAYQSVPTLNYFDGVARHVLQILQAFCNL